MRCAKGLEFDAVFITGIEEGVFPHEQSLSNADQQAWRRGSGLSDIVGAGRDDTPPLRPGAASTQAIPGLRVGQAVIHAKFGEGVVSVLEGLGADARARVHFGHHGSNGIVQQPPRQAHAACRLL